MNMNPYYVKLYVFCDVHFMRPKTFISYKIISLSISKEFKYRTWMRREQEDVVCDQRLVDDEIIKLFKLSWSAVSFDIDIFTLTCFTVSKRKDQYIDCIIEGMVFKHNIRKIYIM